MLTFKPQPLGTLYGSDMRFVVVSAPVASKSDSAVAIDVNVAIRSHRVPCSVSQISKRGSFLSISLFSIGDNISSSNTLVTARIQDP